MLTSLVIDHLQQTRSNENTATIYIYCDYGRRDEQTLLDLVSSLIRQLLSHQESIPENILRTYQDHLGKGTRPKPEYFTELAQSSMEQLSQIYVILDALDELGNVNKVRQDLIEFVRRLQRYHPINLMTTSRYIPTLAQEFDHPFYMDIRASPKDIRRYVEGHIEDLPNCVKKNTELQGEVAKAVVNSVDGM